MKSLLENIDFKAIAASEILTFDKYDIFRRKDNILQLQIYDGYYGELNDAVTIVHVFKELKTTEKCKVLIVSANNASFSKEAREYVASAEVSQIVAADAFVINNLALKILMNGYLKFNKPNRPTKFFNNADAAVEWLLL